MAGKCRKGRGKSHVIPLDPGKSRTLRAVWCPYRRLELPHHFDNNLHRPSCICSEHLTRRVAKGPANEENFCCRSGLRCRTECYCRHGKRLDEAADRVLRHSSAGLGVVEAARCAPHPGDPR